MDSVEVRSRTWHVRRLPHALNISEMSPSGSSITGFIPRAFDNGSSTWSMLSTIFIGFFPFRVSVRVLPERPVTTTLRRADRTADCRRSLFVVVPVLPKEPIVRLSTFDNNSRRFLSLLRDGCHSRGKSFRWLRHANGCDSWPTATLHSCARLQSGQKNKYHCWIRYILVYV